jgi:hypothetical protein
MTLPTIALTVSAWALVASISTLRAAAVVESGALGQPVTVPNFSFEQAALPDDAASLGAAEWLGNGGAYTINPGVGVFTGSAGSGVPPGGSGAQSAALAGQASLSSAASLATVVSGTNYILTIALGDRSDQDPGMVRIGFLIDNAFALGADASFDAANYSPEGTFTDFTFQYTAAPTDAGKPLKVFFGQTGASNFVHFDNVRLSSVLVPEPSAFLLLPGGLLVLGSSRCFRRG